MAAELIYNIVANQETGWSKTFVWTTTTSVTLAGLLVDLTGASAQLQVRQLVTSANPPLINISAPVNGITLGGTAGTIAILITPTNITNAIALGLVAGQQYNYQCDVTLSSGQEVRVLEGTFLVSPTLVR